MKTLPCLLLPHCSSEKARSGQMLDSPPHPSPPAQKPKPKSSHEQRCRGLAPGSCTPRKETGAGRQGRVLFSSENHP